jgi:hypothetical protein
METGQKWNAERKAKREISTTVNPERLDEWVD